MTELTTPPGSLPELISQLAEDDPRLRVLARYLTAQAERHEDGSGTPDESPDREVADVLARLRTEVEELRQRNDALADALGACYLCWGDDRSCPHCHGRGVPGSTRPERLAFTTWVLPAVRRMLPRRPATDQIATQAHNSEGAGR